MSNKMCLVNGCQRKVRCKGYCDLHYRRLWATGDPGPVNPITIKTKSNVKEHPLYETWMAMKKRCYYDKHPQYRNYGGRGIKVCERWLGPYGFHNFIDDMGERPDGLYDSGRPKYTLDRIDVNGDYSPSNCRWATQKEQCSNTRFNHRISCNGEVHTVTEWSEILGIKKSTLFERTRRQPNDAEYQLQELFD